MKKIIALFFLFLLFGQGLVYSFSSDEIVVRDGVANLQKNIEPVKGRLFLTATKLVFESHGLNVQGGTTIINLSDVAVVDTGWSKLLGLIPAVPNALKVTTKNGKVYRFTCYFPGRWKKAVEQQLKSKSS